MARSRLLIAAAIIGCNGAAIVPGIDASTDASDDSTLSFNDGSSSYDAYYPGPPDVIAAPQFDCLDAGDAGVACPLPPSICLDGTWLEYFDDGVCVDGGCQFTGHAHQCYLICHEGGCEGPSLTNAP